MHFEPVRDANGDWVPGVVNGDDTPLVDAVTESLPSMTHSNQEYVQAYCQALNAVARAAYAEGCADSY
jgi:hypothetical protein